MQNLSTAWRWLVTNIFTPFSRWFHAQSRRTQVIVGCVAGVLLIACCALGNAGHTASTTSNNTTSVASHGSTTTHKATATPAPKPTATAVAVAGLSGPLATGGDARLGGTVDAFIARYGTPNVRNQTLVGFQTHCSSGNADCVQISIFPGANNRYYVNTVAFSTPDSQPWPSIATARAACSAGFPADARMVSHETDVKNGLTVGEYEVYVSPSLGHVFTAATFTDANGNTTTPGTFDVLMLVTPSGTYSDCQIAVGSSGA